MAGPRPLTWITLGLAVLVLIPLLNMILMMFTGTNMMPGVMGDGMMTGGMMGRLTRGWPLAWVILVAGLLVAFIVLSRRKGRSDDNRR